MAVYWLVWSALQAFGQKAVIGCPSLNYAHTCCTGCNKALRLDSLRPQEVEQRECGGNCSSISLGWSREIRLRAGSDGNRAGLNVCFLTATEEDQLDVGDTITTRLCTALQRPQNMHTNTYSQRTRGISLVRTFTFLGYRHGNLSGSCYSSTYSGSQGTTGDWVTICKMQAHTCIYILSSTHYSKHSLFPYTYTPFKSIRTFVCLLSLLKKRSRRSLSFPLNLFSRYPCQKAGAGLWEGIV